MLSTVLHAIANPSLVDAITPHHHRLPHSRGLNATVMVTIALETLQGGLGAATMGGGTRISPDEARRMACDAGLLPVVLGGKSEVLDHGRLRRLYSKPQRVAMAPRLPHQHHRTPQQAPRRQ